MFRLFPVLKRSFIHLLIATLLCFSSAAFADTASLTGERDHFYLDKTQLIEQQIDLIKQRLTQADQEYEYLQEEREKGFASFADDQKNKFLLSKTGVRIALVKSNIESINIELSDSLQALSWLDKNIQEGENQVNALKIFGLRLIQGDVNQSQGLRSELKYQEQLRSMEKERARYLQQLQKVESQVLQLYGEQYSQINAFLKSRKLLLIRERQVKSEKAFQEQQNHWLRRLDELYKEMQGIDAREDGKAYSRLENEIFYAHENANLVYLNTSIARYKDELRQLRFSITRTNSISLLNNLSDQTQVLGKQITKLGQLINTRIEIIKKRGVINFHEKQASPAASKVTPAASSADAALAGGGQYIVDLLAAYEKLNQDALHLNKRLADFRLTLDRSVQQELSARQGLPGFSANAWSDLGKEVLLAPTLSFQLVKGFIFSLAKALESQSLGQWSFLVLLEAVAVFALGLTRKLLILVLRQMPDRGGDVINARDLLASLLLPNLLPLALIANAWLLFYFLAIPGGEFAWFLDLAWVWFFFKILLNVARSALVETVHDDQGYDMQLYRRLRIMFVIGMVWTSLTVLLHHLPLIYEIKDLFDRLFLLMLLLVSMLILRSWRVIPHLVLQYIDFRRTYLRRMVYFLGLFAPSLLFVNSLIGLFGFINLVGLISWYEGVFTSVLVVYFMARALLSDIMEELSNLMIQHVSNGWLWTQAFLKPLHKVLRVVLFFAAWTLLFLLYGWNSHSPVVERLNWLMHYPIIHLLNTTIMPVNIIELIFAVSLFYWAAGWTREFVYRLLLSKTKDLGIRNSMAILSQYAVVVMGALVCLRLLGIDLHALFLVASGLLIAISFGLRDLVNNFACGLILLFERPIRVGDIVCINDQEGKVTHIGGRAVTVQTWDHMEIIVPNTELFNKSFINWTVHDDIVRTVICIKIDRQDNPFTVQDLILSVLKEKSQVLRDPEPEIFLRDMMDNHSEFEIRYYVNVRQVPSRVYVRSEVLYALWKAFDQHGVKVPNLQHEIFIKAQTPLLPEPS